MRGKGDGTYKRRAAGKSRARRFNSRDSRRLSAVLDSNRRFLDEIEAGSGKKNISGGNTGPLAENFFLGGKA